jgi:phage-related protein
MINKSKPPLLFYWTACGVEPVREWLKGLPDEDRKELGLDLMRVQWRWPVGMPSCRALGDGLYETRSNLPSCRIARAFFCFYDGCLIALHGCKKTQVTPKDELTIARKRQKEILK